MNKKERKIGALGAFFLTAAAGSVDGVQFTFTLLFTFFPPLTALGLILNTLISLFASISFMIWLSYWHVSFLDSKYMSKGLVGLLGEMIPGISAFPMWTGTIIWIIVTNKTFKETEPSDV